MSSNSYDDYDDDFGLSHKERKQARKATRAPRHQDVNELAEPTGSEGGLSMTYQPARFETIWLNDSLRSFYDQHFISDVLASVKGGKEASVYCCVGGAACPQPLVAAKVYRPRQFRNLRNDHMYREGRAVLTAEGRPVKRSDSRLMRAIGKKTAVGQQVSHTSWLMYEYTTLERLRNAGASVPQPFAVNDNCLLMSYYGEERQAAPTLNGVRLDRREAEGLLEDVLKTVDTMLQHGLIHGDLSAYNILYWEGEITVIDFPQVISTAGNRHAYAVLERDITRVCDYFAQQGVRRDAVQITAELWGRYAAAHPDDIAADQSMLLAQLGIDEFSDDDEE